VVSNHGGRQLDGAIASIEALPTVRAAVGPDFPVLMDSGIRTGEHILKAIAAGASFVLVGRAIMYGVAAGKEDGARTAIGLLIDEARRTAAQLGVRPIAELTPRLLWRAGDPR
jgi:isopentenyl diphosphate isomerase/L-lactate dehydrogenase-like FMN-dependent dehydrogenase